jgi:hypothetical protein
MNAPAKPSLIPLYTSRGEPAAFLVYPHLFNRQGEWIGWVAPNRDVYSVIGDFVGALTNDKRIVRKRAMDDLKPRVKSPAAPPRLRIPPTVPLAPLMSDLPHSLVDVLEDEPERLHTIDSGETRQDLD